MIKRKEYPTPEINRREILRYMQVKNCDELTNALVDRGISLVSGKLCFKTCFAEFPICKKEDMLDLGFAVIKSHDLEKCLDGCDKILLLPQRLASSLTGLFYDIASLSRQWLSAFRR